jgi:hypothetical protein
LPLYPVFKGAKKRTKEKAALHLVRLWRTSLRSLLNADASESRVAPPSRFSAFSFAARLREMAIKPPSNNGNIDFKINKVYWK